MTRALRRVARSKRSEEPLPLVLQRFDILKLYTIDTKEQNFSCQFLLEFILPEGTDPSTGKDFPVDTQALRETLGERHPNTLTTIYSMGGLLEEQGKITEAIPLFTEELEGCVSLHGMAHEETRGSVKHLVELLRNSGQRDEAEALAAKYGVCNDNSDDDSDNDEATSNNDDSDDSANNGNN